MLKTQTDMKAFGRQNKLLNYYPTVRHLKDEIIVVT